MTQKSRLLSYLTQHGSITRLEGFTELGIANLWIRVSEIEALGWVISRERVQVPTRDGHTYVTRYTLVGRVMPNKPPQPAVAAFVGWAYVDFGS
jgi:hypothetical protein